MLVYQRVLINDIHVIHGKLPVRNGGRGFPNMQRVPNRFMRVGPGMCFFALLPLASSSRCQGVWERCSFLLIFIHVKYIQNLYNIIYICIYYIDKSTYNTI